MSLKPQPPRPLPPNIAAWGEEQLEPNDPYRLVGDLFYEQYRDEDFADLFHAEGKPTISDARCPRACGAHHRIPTARRAGAG